MSDEFWQPNIGGPLASAIDLISREVRKYVTHDPPAGLNTETAYYNDHGLAHIQGVLRHAKSLGADRYLETFPIEIQAILCCAIWAHDVGMFVHPAREDEKTIRRLHADRSADFIAALAKGNPGVLSQPLAQLLGELCRAHRRDYDLLRMPASPRVRECDIVLQPDFIGALVRVCDAADVGQGRTPASLFNDWGDAIPEESRKHWQGHALVTASTLAVRTGEVVFHLERSAKAADPLLEGLYHAAEADLHSARAALIRSGGRPFRVLFEQDGEYIVPLLGQAGRARA